MKSKIIFSLPLIFISFSVLAQDPQDPETPVESQRLPSKKLVDLPKIIPYKNPDMTSAIHPVTINNSSLYSIFLETDLNTKEVFLTCKKIHKSILLLVEKSNKDSPIHPGDLNIGFTDITKTSCLVHLSIKGYCSYLLGKKDSCLLVEDYKGEIIFLSSPEDKKITIIPRVRLINIRRVFDQGDDFHQAKIKNELENQFNENLINHFNMAQFINGTL